MRFVLLMFIPLFVHSQTIHQDDEKIVYKGKVPIATISSTDKFNLVKEAFLSTIGKEGKLLSVTTGDEQKFTAKAELPLTSTSAITKSASYQLTVRLDPIEYSYKIDSVQINEHVRGRATTVISSKDFLKRMDQTGDVAMFTETVLNEIDMKIQKLLATTTKKIENNRALK